jgi:hypothetical protein
MSTEEKEPRLHFHKRELKFEDNSSQPPRTVSVSGITAVTSSASHLAVGTFAGRVLVYKHGDDVPDYELRSPIAPFGCFSMRVSALCFDPSGEVLLGAAVDNWIRVRDGRGQVKEYQHTSAIVACAIDPDSRNLPAIACVFVDSTGRIFRLKPKQSFLVRGLGSPQSEAHELPHAAKDVDLIVWKGDIIAWSSLGSFEIFRVSKFGSEKPTQVIPPDRAFSTNYPRTSFIFRSPDEITVCMGGARIECVCSPKFSWKTADQKTDTQLMAVNGDLTARLRFTDDSKQSIVSVEVGDEETLDGIVPIADFESRKYISLCPSPKDFFIAFNDGLFHVTQYTQVERIE